jgi:ABC-2 type transport system ATP-binding protein
MAEAEALAEHVVIFSQGKAVAAGSTAALTRDVNRQSLWFRARSRLDATVLITALPAGHQLAEQSPGRYKLHGATITPAVIATVTSWCADQGALATDIQVEQRSLEDVFLEVTAQ